MDKKSLNSFAGDDYEVKVCEFQCSECEREKNPPKNKEVPTPPSMEWEGRFDAGFPEKDDEGWGMQIVLKNKTHLKNGEFITTREAIKYFIAELLQEKDAEIARLKNEDHIS